ncbi:hypothetical protein QP178_05710 [Sphingomonas aurantiaca]|uniref:hypothetical protein n=1 Tax=Sphingomonas aurantiaca TaxID=185949 RepID=UPI002FDF5530
MIRAVVDAGKPSVSGIPGLFRPEAIAHRSSKPIETLETSSPSDLIGLATFFLMAVGGACWFLSYPAKDASLQPADNLRISVSRAVGCPPSAGFAVPWHSNALTVRIVQKDLSRRAGIPQNIPCVVKDLAVSGLITRPEHAAPLDSKHDITIVNGGRAIASLSDVRFRRKTERSYVISGTIRRDSLDRLFAVPKSYRDDVRIRIVSRSKSMAQLFRTHLFKRIGAPSDR